MRRSRRPRSPSGPPGARCCAASSCPAILPSVLAGAGLAFARAVGEFGSVVLISGNLPFKTEVASSYIYSLSQGGNLPAASAVSVVLVLISLAVLLAIGFARRRFDVPDKV